MGICDEAMAAARAEWVYSYGDEHAAFLAGAAWAMERAREENEFSGDAWDRLALLASELRAASPAAREEEER